MIALLTQCLPHFLGIPDPQELAPHFEPYQALLIKGPTERVLLFGRAIQKLPQVELKSISNTRFLRLVWSGEVQA